MRGLNIKCGPSVGSLCHIEVPVRLRCPDQGQGVHPARRADTGLGWSGAAEKTERTRRNAADHIHRWQSRHSNDGEGNKSRRGSQLPTKPVNVRRPFLCDWTGFNAPPNIARSQRQTGQRARPFGPIDATRAGSFRACGSRRSQQADRAGDRLYRTDRQSPPSQCKGEDAGQVLGRACVHCRADRSCGFSA